MSKRYIPPMIPGESKPERAHRLKLERQARYRLGKKAEKLYGPEKARAIKNLISGAHRHGVEFKNLREVQEFGDYLDTRNAQTNDSKRYTFDLFLKEWEAEERADEEEDEEEARAKIKKDFAKFKEDRAEIKRRAAENFPETHKPEKPKRQYKRDARGRFSK